MATDATGTPTPLGIPKFNTSADAPSGLGSNAQMDSIDALIAARVTKPTGIVSGEAAVWNGTGWDRSSVTRLGVSSLGSGTPDATKFLRGDGSWQIPSVTVASLDKVVGYVYGRQTTTQDINTSLAETSLLGTPSVGTWTIAGNDMGTSRMLRLTLIGDALHNNVAADTLTWRVKFGGTTFYAGTDNFGAVTGTARIPWHMSLWIANLGAANSQMIEGQIGPHSFANAAAPTTGIGNLDGGARGTGEIGISTLGTIDTTAAQTLDVTAQWSASSANNSIRMRYAVLELV